MESDDDLDYCSEKFNPLKALTDLDVILPVPDAPVYDNLSQFISVIRSKGKQESVDEAGSSKPSTSYNFTGLNVNRIGRNFLPHQEPVMGRSRSRPLRNVLTRMEEVTRGPMAVLRNCMINKTRVKVSIRGPCWIRGYCTGYIAAFDKQWNLAMTDVDETWTRMRHRKTPTYGPVEHITCRLDDMNIDENEKEGARLPCDEQYEDANIQSAWKCVNEETSLQVEPNDMNEDRMDKARAGDRYTEKAPEKTEFNTDTETTETDEPTEATFVKRQAKVHADRQVGKDRASTSSHSFASLAKNQSCVVSGTERKVIATTSPFSGLVIREVHGRYEKCQRHINQLFVRGEQVALVTVLHV